MHCTEHSVVHKLPHKSCTVSDIRTFTPTADSRTN